jgi:hypothetical protein
MAFSEAVAKLLEDHDESDVRLYLSVCAQQWPDNAGVRAALEGLNASA